MAALLCSTGCCVAKLNHSKQHWHRASRGLRSHASQKRREDGFASYQHLLFAWRTVFQAPSESSASFRLNNGLKIQCLREPENDEGRASEDERHGNDGEVRLQTNGRSGALMHNWEDHTTASSHFDVGEDHNASLNDLENISDQESVQEGTWSSLEDTLGAVIIEAAEKVAEAASSSIEAVAETVEVAAQTVSAVGEIKAFSIIEEPVIDNCLALKAVVDRQTALKTVAFWIGSAVTFGALVGFREGTGKASEFFAGYLLEQSLSVDNLFVFVLIFNYFKVPFEFQSRVLTYGVAGAVVFRAIMIGLGIVSLERFEGLNLIFASILLFSSFKLVTGDEDEGDDLTNNSIVNLCRKFIPVTPTYDGNNFLTTVNGVQKATPLLLTLVVVELSDIAFAVDSIPAVFGVTRDPLIVYTSNIFAILGLRSLYTVISGHIAELVYLQPAVGIILAFIGSKMIGEFFGVHIPTEASLGVVGVVLGAGIALSLNEQSHKKNKND